MSAVIEFPANRVSARPPATPVLKSEVLIFTGVQVERRNFKPAERSSTARGAKAQAAADPS